MRVLSISHRMQHRLIDNHTIFNAPAVFDYDAIVIDAGGVFETVQQAARAEAAFTTRASVPVVNGESLDGVTGIADVLNRRREEFTRALERGAVVAVFAHPPDLLTGIHGMHGLERYFFLPAPPGMAWNRETIRGGEGPEAAVSDPDHPFAGIVDLIRAHLLYRCYFNERAPGFAGRARVFARSAGGAPVGVEFPVLGGRVVFLPTPRETGASWLAARLGREMVDTMRAMLGLTDEDRPRWVLDTEVPGLKEREVALQAARNALDRARREVAEAEEAAAGLARLRDVLWAGTEHSLLPAVLRCAQALGFESAEEGDQPVLRAPEGRAHLVVAASDDAVGMAPHYRLRRRLDAEIESRARPPRGLIVANGRRLQKPQERAREITPALQVAAEATRYAVVTSRWLFVAAIAALEGGLNEEELAAVRRRLLETDGAVDFADLLAPPEEETAESAEGEPTADGTAEPEAEAEAEADAEAEPETAEHRP